MDRIKGLVESYEKWVAANPDTICDVETTAKWVSYFIAGRISDSNVVSEMMYSLSNMLVLYNDRILDKAKPIDPNEESNNDSKSQSCYRLKVLLTTLEYCEVFLEISAKRIFGNKGKWIFIGIVQVCKAVGRLYILKNSTESIITSPPLPSLNRREIIKQHKNGYTSQPTAPKAPSLAPEQANFTFQLKRSGRVVRKVEGAPPFQYRDFNLKPDIAKEQKGAIPIPLSRAEYIYIVKPLVHLAALGFCGTKSWKQFAVSFALDLLSIKMYHKNRHLMTSQQKRELSRRCVHLLMYLVRSPFYEKYTQHRLEGILGFVANHVPIAKLLAAPLKDYLPHWQNTYFYIWST